MVSLGSGKGNKRGWCMRMLLFLISLIIPSLSNPTFIGIQNKCKRKIKQNGDCMNLKDVMLSQISQSRMDKYWLISLT